MLFYKWSNLYAELYVQGPLEWEESLKHLKELSVSLSKANTVISTSFAIQECRKSTEKVCEGMFIVLFVFIAFFVWVEI